MLDVSNAHQVEELTEHEESLHPASLPTLCLNRMCGFSSTQCSTAGCISLTDNGFGAWHNDHSRRCSYFVPHINGIIAGYRSGMQLSLPKHIR